MHVVLYRWLLQCVMKQMLFNKAHGVIVEYPSYGLYENLKPTDKRI